MTPEEEIAELAAKIVTIQAHYNAEIIAIRAIRDQLDAMAGEVTRRLDLCQRFADGINETVGTINKLGLKYIERERARIDSADWWKDDAGDGPDDDYGIEP